MNFKDAMKMIDRVLDEEPRLTFGMNILNDKILQTNRSASK